MITSKTDGVLEVLCSSSFSTLRVEQLPNGYDGVAAAVCCRYRAGIAMPLVLGVAARRRLRTSWWLQELV